MVERVILTSNPNPFARQNGSCGKVQMKALEVLEVKAEVLEVECRFPRVLCS